MNERHNSVTVYFDSAEDAECFAADVAVAHLGEMPQDESTRPEIAKDALYSSAARMSAIKLQVEEKKRS